MNSQDLAIRLYQSIAEDNERRVMECWHASSLAQCPRAQFYNRKGIEPLQSLTGAKKLRFDIGHDTETRIRPHLKKLFPNLESNLRLTSETLDLTGEMDNFNPDTNSIIEVKSVHANAARNKKVADDRHHLRDDKQYLHHEWQQHAYVLLLAEQGITVESITYLYVTLSGLLIPYVTPVDPIILAEVKTRIDGLNACWEKDILPPCYCGDPKNKFYRPVLQYCDYRTTPPNAERPDAGCCSDSLWGQHE